MKRLGLNSFISLIILIAVFMIYYPMPSRADEIFCSSLACMGTDGDDLISNIGAIAVNIFAGKGNDIIIGSNDVDHIYGNEGIDTILGRGGDDILEGGFDDDKIDVGNGNDRILGQEGMTILQERLVLINFTVTILPSDGG